MRTIEEVNKDYSNLCANLGHLSYQIEVLKKRSEQLLSELALTQKEADELSAKGDKNE